MLLTLPLYWFKLISLKSLLTTAVPLKSGAGCCTRAVNNRDEATSNQQNMKTRTKLETGNYKLTAQKPRVHLTDL